MSVVRMTRASLTSEGKDVPVGVSDETRLDFLLRRLLTLQKHPQSAPAPPRCCCCCWCRVRARVVSLVRTDRFVSSSLAHLLLLLFLSSSFSGFDRFEWLTSPG